jgi:hypothetical protein
MTSTIHVLPTFTRPLSYDLNPPSSLAIPLQYPQPTHLRLVIRQRYPSASCLTPFPFGPRLGFQLNSVRFTTRCRRLPPLDFRFVSVEEPSWQDR